MAAALAGAALAFAVPVRAGTADDAAIRSVQAELAAAWNGHDAAAYLRLLTDDADVVTMQGGWWKGQAEIRRGLTAAFATDPARRTIDDIAVRPLSDGLALAHVRWSKTNDGGSDGMSPRRGIQTQLLRRDGGRWRIASAQDTPVLSTRPSPPAAPPRDEPPSATARPATRRADERPCLVASQTGCLIHRRARQD